MLSWGFPLTSVVLKSHVPLCRPWNNYWSFFWRMYNHKRSEKMHLLLCSWVYGHATSNWHESHVSGCLASLSQGHKYFWYFSGLQKITSSQSKKPKTFTHWFNHNSYIILNNTKLVIKENITTLATSIIHCCFLILSFLQTSSYPQSASPTNYIWYFIKFTKLLLE